MKSHSTDRTFLDLINRHLGIAHKVGRMYFPEAEDQEDVIQEMMYQLWRSYPNFDQRAKFSTWMYRVCLNTALTHRRKQSRKVTESLSSVHQEIPQPPEESGKETIDQLWAAIATLPDLNRAIVLLYLDDLSYREIADITGLTVSNVSVRLVRIKIDLEKILTKNKTIEDANA